MNIVNERSILSVHTLPDFSILPEMRSKVAQRIKRSYPVDFIASIFPPSVRQKGSAATEAWTEAKKRTTAAGLGGMVYSKLLKCGFTASLHSIFSRVM